VRLKALIKKAKWRTAKTHEEYVVVFGYPELKKLITGLIKEKGYYKMFKGKKYRYYNFEGYRYWIVWPILNREKNK
jgi:hypothetical protein